MKHLAIIPARSGSKGLKDKNIALLNGKPLMAYTIQAAISSELFENVIVSTDSKEYAEIAQKYGAEIPFLRDSETATDQASSWAVVKEVIEKMYARGMEFDTFALLQPTSPLRTAEDIKKAYKLFDEKKADSVISVCPVEHSPLWCNTLPEDGSMEHFLKNGIAERRQDSEIYYRLNGAIYISKVKNFMKEENIYNNRSVAMVMDSMKSIDIDSKVDFVIAEVLMKLR